MLAKKPVIAIYKGIIQNNTVDDDLVFNAFPGKHGETYSFRCPNKSCGRAVKVGYIACPFCNQRLKWRYPFKYVN